MHGKRRAYGVLFDRATGVLFCLTLLFLYATQAYAQTQSESTKPDPSSELRRQRERESFERQRQEAQPDVRTPQPSTPSSVRLPTTETPCFGITQVDIIGEGSEQFTWLQSSLSGAQTSDTPIGKCLGTSGINILLDRAQHALIAAGFVTSRVLAPPQNLSSGVLKLSLIPGHIHAIRFEQPTQRHGALWTAVPVVPGDTLNIRDIEQTLENFKRVPTADAQFKIEPVLGGKPGDSDIVIRYTQPMPLRLALNLLSNIGTGGTAGTIKLIKAADRVEEVVAKAGAGASSGDRLLWGSWKDYPKVTVEGREYAQIGDRLYTEHAVNRTQPSGSRYVGGDGELGNGQIYSSRDAGRSISPSLVDDVIQNGTKTIVTTPNGVTRTVHTSGTVQVVTEQNGRLVVTVNPFSGVK
jgi:hypothetical protein